MNTLVFLCMLFIFVWAISYTISAAFFMARNDFSNRGLFTRSKSSKVDGGVVKREWNKITV